MSNYYEILGVEQNATAQDIRSRYLFLARAFHPDRFSEPERKAVADNEMKRINVAYTVLSNPQKREEYDAKLKGGDTEGNQHTASHPDDETLRAQVSEMFSYIGQVFDRWHHILEPLPDLSATRVAFEVLTQSFEGILNRLLPDKNLTQKQTLIEDCKQKVIEIISINILLGAEFENLRDQSKFELSLLQYLTNLPVLQTFHGLLEEGQINRRVTESESVQLVETMAKRLSFICQVSEEIGRSIVQNRKQTRQSATYASSSQKSRTTEPYPSQPENNKRESYGYCQSCFANTPTENVNFHQTIGAIVVRFHRKIEGALCADCIEKYFWEMTGITLFLGWWGYISVIETPFILIGNIVNYLRGWKLRENSDNLSKIAVGWKVAILIPLIVLFFVIAPNLRSWGSAQIQSPQPTVQRMMPVAPSKIPAPTVRPTQTAVSRKPTATKNPCVFWNKVTLKDKGKTLCVYGTVKKAYWAGTQFTLTFSEENSNFRMIIRTGYYYKDIVNKSVMVKGEIKTLGDIIYIYVDEGLQVEK